MEELIEIINELSSSSAIELKEDDKKEISSRIKQIYSDTFRYSYSFLSAILEDKLPEEREQIEYNLRELLPYFDDDDEKSKKFYKLLDHVSLESMRLNRMAKVEYFSDEAAIQKQEVEKIYHEIEKKVSKLNKRVDHSYGQIVSILGIFTAIVLSCVFAFQFFQSSLNVLSDVNFYKVLFFCLIISFTIFNLVFMLLFVIGKLSGMSLAVNYNIGKAKHKNALNMLRVKYPYVFYFNVVIVLLSAAVYFLKCR